MARSLFPQCCNPSCLPPAPQGALDGGLDIPYSEKRFIGYRRKKKNVDPEIMRKYIYGGHVSEYMEELQEEDPESYRRQFAKWIAEGVEPDDVEDIYKEVGAPRGGGGEGRAAARAPALNESRRVPAASVNQSPETYMGYAEGLMAALFVGPLACRKGFSEGRCGWRGVATTHISSSPC